MRRYWLVLLFLSGLAVAAPSYTYDTYKADLLRMSQDKKVQKVLSFPAWQNFILKDCGGQTKKLSEASDKVGQIKTPPLVVYTYGSGKSVLTVTLVDYGGMAGKSRLKELDIGPMLYDSKKNPAWKQPTYAYKPNPQTVGFGYVTDKKEAAIRLVVAGRFDLRLEHSNTSSLKPLEACLAKINLVAMSKAAAR